MPSIETLEISRNKAIKPIPSELGDEDEADIPDMADYDEPDNLIETDAVSCYIVPCCQLIQIINN